MFFLYADESGDVGIKGSPTRYFILSGFVVHELRWNQILKDIIQFRRQLKDRYGLKLREEIHAADFIHHPGDLQRIRKSLRLQILRDVLDFESKLPDISIINVVVDKSNCTERTDVFEIAWKALIQRFHNTLSHRNFPGPQNSDDRGLLIVDQTDELKLRSLARRMRRYNPVPKIGGGTAVSIPLTLMVEDPVHRNSLHSYFIQLADVNAYMLMQKLAPCSFIKRKGGKNYFDRLDPVLCTAASRTDRMGIVFL